MPLAHKSVAPKTCEDVNERRHRLEISSVSLWMEGSHDSDGQKASQIDPTEEAQCTSWREIRCLFLHNFSFDMAKRTLFKGTNLLLVLPGKPYSLAEELERDIKWIEPMESNEDGLHLNFVLRF